MSAGPPRWLDELDLGDRPPWMPMGIHALDRAGWLVADDRRPVELALKRHLLSTRHDDVFRAREGTERAGQETLDLVRRHLSERDDSRMAPGSHPLETAALLVQEDLCLMVERDGAYHLDAAAVCFPSYWRLADKMGRSAASVHGPVPRYAEELERKVDTFLARLTPERPVWRRNWGLHDNHELFAPVEPPARALTPGRLGQELWLRSEYQTLRRLPRSGAVLFTIRTQQVPLEVLRDRPDVARQLAGWLRASPRERSETRIPHGSRELVLAWLDRC